MRVAIVLVPLFLAACQTPCPSVNAGPTQAAYQCADGSTLSVTFINTAPQSAIISQEGYTTMSLPSRAIGEPFGVIASRALVARFTITRSSCVLSTFT